MISPVMPMQAPHLAPGMFDMLEVSDTGIMGPDFTAPPGADIEDRVKDGINHTAMTNRHDALTAVAFGHLFHKETNTSAEVHIGFAKFIATNQPGTGRAYSS